MSLPIEWVEKLFSKLTLNYGVDFLNRYKGIPIASVKTDWSEELGGFGGAQISFALSILPDRPPTAQQFRNLCLQAPEAEKPKLPEPKADPARVAAELAKLAPLIEQARSSPAVDYDRLAWAKSIMRDHKGGLRRTPTVVAMARRALGVET